MANAITWGSLFGVGFILAGLVCIAGAALAIFAGGMSAAPAAGDSATSTGCAIGVGGVALLALGIWLVS